MYNQRSVIKSYYLELLMLQHLKLITENGFEILVLISCLYINTLYIIHLDVLYGDPSKTYYVDDIVKPDDYSDEDEVAEEVM